MQYLIQVWEHPAPLKFEEAESILDRLFREGADTPSAKLDRLVKTLWTRYPRDIDSDASDPVWADTFSKNGRQPLKVETLAISTKYLDEVIPIVAKIANDLGLVAYDPQYGTVYLADGRTLGRVPPAAREAAPALARAPGAPARLIGLEEASSLFVSAMGPLMAAHGFQWRRMPTGDAWVRDFPGGQQKLAPVLDSIGPSAGLAMVMRANLFAVDPFVHQFTQPRKPKPTDVLFVSLRDYLVAAGDPRADSLFQRYGLAWRIAINSTTKLSAAVAALQEIVPAVVADMHPFGSVPGLWQTALEEAQGRRKARFTESIEAKLVAGALQGSTLLDEVAAQELARYEESLALRRKGASEAKLEMLAGEEVRIKESLARLVDFVRAQMRADS